MKKMSKTKTQLLKELASLQRTLRSVERAQSGRHRGGKRSRRQESLLKKEVLLNQITNHMRDIVVLTDAKMVLQYVTPSVQTILGYDLDKIVGTPVLALIHEHDIEGVSKVLTYSLQSRKSGKAEFRYRHAQGHYVWLETLGDLILNKKGGSTLLFWYAVTSLSVNVLRINFDRARSVSAGFWKPSTLSLSCLISTGPSRSATTTSCES